ncbi:uncharacterized protein MELLADRAFT_86098 [Melampsora larici-populina 98AG31]|uniref:Uncharacterized protein n=1 Tax=Melampsora larici-populina (strain 98AG31 / pathotype 3-4-7) TaxID=747676 RepID=F4SDI8_MELLP|nr:uncharacterized protein MELLADRAFT_86098 [Melampsora larici-populina 98AG31]EGF97288.1 hypothetical protein MELLADRAFT_86098 [Melampsora larici-populina 98AG31]
MPFYSQYHQQNPDQSASQSRQSSRVSSRSGDFQHYQDPSASQSGRSIRMSICSRDPQQDPSRSASRSGQSTRMSMCSRESQQYEDRRASQSGRSTKMSVCSEFQQYQDHSPSQSRQSSRMSFHPENNHQLNSSPEARATYQHPPLLLPSRTPTSRNSSRVHSQRGNEPSPQAPPHEQPKTSYGAAHDPNSRAHILGPSYERDHSTYNSPNYNLQLPNETYRSLTSPSVSLAPPQAFNLRPNDGTSQPEHIVFQQQQTQPAPLTTLSRTPQSSNTGNVNNQSWDSRFQIQNRNDNQRMQQAQSHHSSIVNPTIGHATSREPSLTSPSHIVLQQQQAQPTSLTTLSRMPQSSIARNLNNQPWDSRFQTQNSNDHQHMQQEQFTQNQNDDRRIQQQQLTQNQNDDQRMPQAQLTQNQNYHQRIQQEQLNQNQNDNRRNQQAQLTQNQDDNQRMQQEQLTQNRNANQCIQQEQLHHMRIVNPTIGHPPGHGPSLSFPSVRSVPPQSFDLRPNDGPSQPECIAFPQPHPHPTTSTSSRMSIDSAEPQPINLRPNDGPSQLKHIVLQQQQAQPTSLTTLSRMPQSSIARNLNNQPWDSRFQTQNPNDHQHMQQEQFTQNQNDDRRIQQQQLTQNQNDDQRMPQAQLTQNQNYHQRIQQEQLNQNQNDNRRNQQAQLTQNQDDNQRMQQEQSTQNRNANQCIQQEQLHHMRIVNPTIGHPPGHGPSLSFPSVRSVPPQSFDLRPNDGPSQPERIAFPQPHPHPTTSTSSRMSIDSAEPQPNQQPSPRQTIQSQRMEQHTEAKQSCISAAPPRPSEETEDQHAINNEGQAEDEVQELDADTEESDSPEVFDLVEDRTYQNRGAARRARDTMARHDGTRYEKLAKPPVECSPYERLTIAIQHYHNILLGIVRKGKGRKGHRLLPPPPSDDEYSTWDKRKIERRRIIDKSVAQAQARYRRKHPQAHPAQLTKVGDHAAEDALSTIPPVKFTSLVALRNSGVHYSTTVASTCEGALALSGFTRFTYDWTDTIKSRWNEAVSSIILQEWEKCYKRGDADDYDIDTNHVTAKNLRQVLDRWFSTKAREYVSQCNQAAGQDNANQAQQQEAAKEKTRRRESQKRTFFTQHRGLQAIISERSIHSEDEVGLHRSLIPKAKAFGGIKILSNYFHELDALVHQRTAGDQAITSAHKNTRSRPYAAAEEADFRGRPPKGFPKALLDQQFMNQHVSRAGLLSLGLSSHHCDLTPLIAHLRWLQLPECS